MPNIPKEMIHPTNLGIKLKYNIFIILITPALFSYCLSPAAALTSFAVLPLLLFYLPSAVCLNNFTFLNSLNHSLYFTFISA